MSKQVDQQSPSSSDDKPDRDAGSSQKRKFDDFSEAAEEAENAKKSAKIQAEKEEKEKKGADYDNKFSDVKASVKAKHLKKENFDPEPEQVKKALAEVDAEVKSLMAMDPAEPERTVEGGEPSDSALAAGPKL